MRALRALIALVVVVVVALLAGGNVTPVRLDYVVGQVQVPLAAALFGALVIGVLLGWAATYGRVLRLRWRQRRSTPPSPPSPPTP